MIKVSKNGIVHKRIHSTPEYSDMLKDVLVHIPSDDRTKSIIDYAISLARNFGADLDVLVRIFRSFNPAGAISISGIATAMTTQFDPAPPIAETRRMLETMTVPAR